MRVGVVEYINTLPFLQCLRKLEQKHELSINLGDPARCADMFANAEVDLALVPVGALDRLAEYRIVTDFCIGSFGPVDTVAVLSHQPIEQLNTIYLDTHSRTSSILIQILSQFYLNIKIEFIAGSGNNINAGHLFIGDKVKEKEQQFSLKTDLGELWTTWTNKPMVFAVWVANSTVSNSFIKELNEAYSNAISNIHKIELNGFANAAYWQNYLNHSIRFEFDESAKEGLEHFQKLKNKLQ